MQLSRRPRLAALAFSLALPLAFCTAAHAQGPEGGGMRQGGGAFAGMQRAGGELKAVDGKTLTLKAEDGSTVLVVLTDNTRLMRGSGGMRMGGPGTGAPEYSRGNGEGRMGNMQPAKLEDLKPGDGVMAMGQLDPSTKTLHAAMVIATDGATLAAMRANLGKTYIAGKVTAIDLDNAKMTVLRSDGVSQTIGFDESTSFRRGGGRRMRSAEGNAAPAPAPSGESITLADIKVGDNVAGQGAIKGGTFVPAQLTVMAPRPPRPSEPAPAK